MNTRLITIFGIFFIFFMTTLGASFVYFVKKDISGKFNALLLGLSSGIMIASSIWSLILPSFNLCENWGKLSVLPVCVGLILGTIFLIILDKVVPNTKPINGFCEDDKIKYKKLTKMFVAITMHNIPEGLAVGFAFGIASVTGTNLAFTVALGLAIGIGIQNFPEGLAVALPINIATKNKHKGFLFGMLSGAVEPIFAVVGYFLAASLISLQPWLLSFAAGTMLFVVVEELIPEASTNSSRWASIGFMTGFIIMLVLDVIL